MQNLNNTSATPRQTENIVRMTVMLGDRKINVHGREAWALNALLERGETGVTPLTWVGPRWSDYIRKLRLRDFEIETVNQRHEGPFAGRHGKYVLRSIVTVIERVRAGEAAHAA